MDPPFSFRWRKQTSPIFLIIVPGFFSCLEVLGLADIGGSVLLGHKTCWVKLFRCGQKEIKQKNGGEKLLKMLIVDRIIKDHLCK